ncbi:hypothetical protein BH11PLA1_BH11PLA1_08400 [soil metagenome]
MADSAAATLTNITGAVKWFDPKKGFGFIIGPEGQDIFAHYTKIFGAGFRVLQDGAKVNYDAVRGAKGWNATRITRLDEPDNPQTSGAAPPASAPPH